MWSRKELKKNAKRKIKTNYWATIAVCFLLAFFTAEYTLSTNAVYEYDNSESYTGKVVQKKTKNTNSEVLDHLEKDINYKEKIGPKREKAKEEIIDILTRDDLTTFRIIEAITNFLEHNNLKAIISIISIILSLLYIIFIKNILRVGERKFFLTNKKGTKIREILYIYKNRKVKNTAYIMFTRDVYLVLWAFTIVGIFIKFYQYKMLSYIVADNPDITKKEAYALTKEMMKGNKWRTFILDLSFIWWYVLLILSFGLVGIFFVNPYIRATETELYLYLKEKKKAKIKEEKKPKERKSILQKEKVKYSIVNLIFLFFIFAIIGYFYEVIYHFIKSGDLVNRGTLFGPWLPIYGYGGVLSLIFLQKVKQKPVLTFLLVMFISGVMEYFTSYFLEVTKGVKYWDYSGFMINLNGRICLEGLLAFAFAGCLCIYIIGPKLNNLLNKIPIRLRWLLVVLLISLMFADNVYSHYHPNTGKGITYSCVYKIKDIIYQRCIF